MSYVFKKPTTNECFNAILTYKDRSRTFSHEDYMNRKLFADYSRRLFGKNTDSWFFDTFGVSDDIDFATTWFVDPVGHAVNFD